MFPNELLPNKTMVNHLMNFRETGNVVNRKRNCRGTARTDDKLEDLWLSFVQSLSNSLRTLSQQKNMSCISKQGCVLK